jgi:hypothetical protein
VFKRSLIALVIFVGFILPLLCVNDATGQDPSGARKLIRDELTRYGILVNGAYSGGEVSGDIEVSSVTITDGSGGLSLVGLGGNVGEIRTSPNGTQYARVGWDYSSWMFGPRLVSFGSAFNVQPDVGIQRLGANELYVNDANGSYAKLRVSSLGVQNDGIRFHDVGNNQHSLSKSDRADLTDNTATTVATITVAAGNRMSGWGFFEIEATDGTEHQARSGWIRFSAINKSGTHTIATPAESGALDAFSSGTLTTSWSMTADGDNVLLKVNANTSLTSTTFRCRFSPLVVINTTAPTVTIP